MVLSSDNTEQRLIKTRRSAIDFLNFFSTWTGIKTRELTPKYMFIPEHKAGPTWIASFKLRQVDYVHLQSDLFETKTR